MPNPVDPNKGIPSIRPMFRTLGIAASGLTAQRLRMETIATNIANAETTHTSAGGPYRRRMVQMEAATAEAFRKSLDAVGDGPATEKSPAGARAVSLDNDPMAAAADAETAATTDGEPWGVRVSAIVEDQSEGPLVYDPAHPDANATGYVRYPNVRITDEMMDLMDAKRMYEANVTVFQATKQMLRRAIDI